MNNLSIGNYRVIVFHWWRVSALQWPGLSAAAKWAGGIAPQRTIPRYAPQSFVQWFRRRGERKGGETVMLWPDTFNNYFGQRLQLPGTDRAMHGP
jgi:hypothetical protein